MKIVKLAVAACLIAGPLPLVTSPASAQYRYPDACVQEAMAWADRQTANPDADPDWYGWVQGYLNVNCPPPGGTRFEGVGGTGDFPSQCPSATCNNPPPPPPTRIPPKHVD